MYVDLILAIYVHRIFTVIQSKSSIDSSSESPNSISDSSLDSSLGLRHRFRSALVPFFAFYSFVAVSASSTPSNSVAVITCLLSTTFHLPLSRHFL